MRRALASSLLSLLLVTTLVWGGCISCEQFFMWPGAKSCCAASGHCKTKAPAKQASGPECKQIAYDYHTALDTHIELPFVSLVVFHPPVAAYVRVAAAAAGDPSPPDLPILHSAFLI